MTTARDTSTVGVRFPNDLLARVDNLAILAGLTRSGAVLLACSAGISTVARAIESNNDAQETK